MLKRTGRLTAFGLILCLLLACFGAVAAEGIHTEVANGQLDVTVRLGYDGKITYGKPIPVRVTIRNNGADLEGVLAVNTYASVLKYDRFETEIFVPGGGERTVVLPVKSASLQEIFTAEILKDGKVICAVNASPEGVINPSAMMIGVYSGRPKNLAMLDISQENDALSRYEFWQTIALTPETMPEDPELLDAFGMMVLDDTDPALLTEKQQSALKDWVREGHILLCGGGTAAPRNLAFLGDITGLKTEDFTVSDSVHESLESFLSRKSTGRHPEVALAKITGEEPLVTDTKGNGLVWKIRYGAGSIYVTAWEAGDAVLNAESLMHLFYQQMLVNQDLTLYSACLYTREKAWGVGTPGEDVKIPVKNMLPAAAGVIGAGMAVGFALWIILNRHGASKWMWAGIPLIALAAAAVIALLSGSATTNRPVAAVAMNMVQGRDSPLSCYTAVTAAAPKAGIHRYSMDGERLEVTVWDENYWSDEEEDNKPKVPGTLRMIRSYGEQSSAAANAATPWERTELRAVRNDGERADIRVEIWKESDGFHGTIVNNSDFSLKAGAVVCMWGYARIPAMVPGGSAEFAMIAEDAADPYAPVFRDGKMIQNASASIYTVVNQMYFGTGDNIDYNGRESILSGMITSASDLLASADEQKQTGRNDVVFLYCAEPENTKIPVLRADGEKMKSVSAMAMMTVQADYLVVGKTGVVFRAPGMDEAVRCTLDSEGMPTGDMEILRGSGYYSEFAPLAEKPTFRFTPEGIENLEISSLKIGMDQWYVSDSKLFVLNVNQRVWVEVPVNQPLKRPEQYVDKNGNLYCQFRSASGENYAEIPKPTLTLEGRVKDAET